ncbi:dihydrofolate reductase [Piscinibacter sp. XHJ-5]|uniref:dihydrofolate reductase n=1 Tax=Piscinibacter sp. XHJ-5 TaxID=3037797 RepID=UPI0024531A06|nr:dihydrofolate reductase [Piscinibacter sp. XHJ-5]
MSRPLVILIAAVARNGAIGKNNELLARISEDLKFFKRTTVGHPVLMGRKTWDSIGRPLPGRRNIVITRNAHWHAEGAERADSIAAALERASDADKVFVIGGAQIYAQALPLADALVLTEIDADLDGDVFFPPWERGRFTASVSDPQTSEQGLAYRWVTYRKQPGA